MRQSESYDEDHSYYWPYSTFFKDQLTYEKKNLPSLSSTLIDCDFIDIGQTKWNLKLHLAEHKLAIKNQKSREISFCEHSILIICWTGIT